MEQFLFLLIILLLGYIFYQDRTNRLEREKLELKLISKSATEYKEVTEGQDENTPQPKESPYVAVEEAPEDKILTAQDKI